MKKLVFIFQILIFAFMQISPAYSIEKIPLTQIHSAESDDNPKFFLNDQAYTEATVTAEFEPSMPRGYKPKKKPIVVDSTAFYYRLKDSVGKRTDVEGEIGNFGASLGQDFMNQVYKIEKTYNTDVQLIFTMDTTMEDARILQAKLRSKGEQVAIVTVPREVKKLILESAEMESKGRLKAFFLQTGATFKQIITQPKQTAKTAWAITKNQYEKPAPNDIKLGAISAGVAGSIATVAAFGVGIDNMTMTGILTGMAVIALKTGFVGSAALYNKTIVNFLNVGSLINEFRAASETKKALREVYYAIGSSTITSFNGHSMGVGQIAESATSGVADSATSSQVGRIQNEKANARIFWSLFTISGVANLLGALGITGPTIVEIGSVNVTTLLATTLTTSLTVFSLLKFKPELVQKIVTFDLAWKNKRGIKDLANLTARFNKFKSTSSQTEGSLPWTFAPKRKAPPVQKACVGFFN